MQDIKNLDKIFNPASIAIVGASEDPTKMGNWCVHSLLRVGYSGRIFPVNPNSKEILGIKAWRSIRDIPQKIDLAIIVIPAKGVPSSIIECADKGAFGAIIISAGFREMDDPSGLLLEKEIVKIARERKIRLIGPNTFGMIHTHANLNASFSPSLSHVKKGNISMLGQSGGICHLLMYSAIHDGVGLNKVVGLGNRSDLDFPEMIEYLDKDPLTESIAIYIEGMENPMTFLKKARSVISKKPIVVMKGGETDAVKKASLAHTGAMAGNYELYKASFRQWGMIWVEDPLELLDVSKALSILPPPKGDRIAVMSIQAGPGIIMTDLCIKKGLSLARFEKETLDIIKEPWRNMTIRTNPVDMGFATTPGPFQKTIKAVLRDPNVDAILLGVIDPSDIFRDYFSEDLIGVAMEENKPIVVSYVSANHEGAKRVWEELEGKGIVFYPLPSRAVNALAGMVEYGRMLNRQKGLL